MDIISSGAIANFEGIVDISMEDSNTFRLDELMIQAYAQTASAAHAEQLSVLRQLRQDHVTSNPEELFKLQQRTADYNLQLSLISTLTRKGVSAVETLLRS